MKITTGSLLLFCMLALSSFNAAAQVKKTEGGSSPVFLKGQWVEFWSYDKKSDVNYNDTFRISIKSGKPVLYSVGPHTYEFKKVKYLNGLLSFILINGSYSLPYSLRFNGEEQALLGKATGIDSVTVKIKWKKIPD